MTFPESMSNVTINLSANRLTILPHLVIRKDCRNTYFGTVLPKYY